ncbi:MAG: NAD-dependent malic enzyme [Syntrophaceae bacterium]|nr:NAD-dependent malic enzyme [Syntrophaceae bacterium]
MSNFPLVRTIRFKNVNVPGILGKITTAIGNTGTSIGNITTIHLGNRYVIRDMDVFIEGRPHLSRVLKELIKIPEIQIVEIRDAVLELHKNGLVGVKPTKRIDSLEDIRKLYFPGAKEVCTLLQEKDEWKNTYTSVPYNIAVVTNGSSVFDFKPRGAIVAMPVIEAKAALLNRLSGVNGYPVLLDAYDTKTFVEGIRRIASGYSGIHLSNVSSDYCFDVMDILEKELEMPVIHDDQQGNATVVIAALINASRTCRVDLMTAKVGVIGLGVTGLGIARFIKSYTGNPIWGATQSAASAKRHTADGGIMKSLEEIMKQADIVIATTSKGKIISPDMIRKDQIVFALSQPEPEIDPEEAMAAGSCLAINSKAINNLLCCPGLWRGTLDAQAQIINFAMYRAAAQAIAKSATEGEILPTTLDSRVHQAVTHAVASAAIETGVARRKLEDDYFENMDIMKPPWM